MVALEHAGGIGPDGPTRRLAVVLHADVAGYSRLMDADEAGTHARLIGFRQLIDAALQKHGGTLIGTAGDAVLATFTSVTGGLAAAIAMQRAMAERNVGVPADEQLLFRIGLNLGDVIVDGADIFGTGVNVAARLEALAEPGGIAVAGAVRDQVAGKVDVAFTDRGLCHVKNIAEPIRVYAVAGSTGESRSRRPALGRQRAWRVAITATGSLAVIGILFVVAPEWLQRTDGVVVTESDNALARIGKPTIAVLPFRDQSDAGGQDYFSDGVTEDVIRALGRFSGLLVLSWNAVAPFKGQTVALDELGEELGARYVVGGTIRQSGNQLRVSVELTDTQRGVLLWSERFDDRLEDIFAVQDRITQQVVAALAGRVRQLEQAEALAKPTESLGAYDLVLRGRNLLRRVERDANFDARSLFERAIAIDPSYADAHVGLGWTYLNDFLWGWTQWPHRAVLQAEASARRGLELDDRNAAAHALRAFIYTFHREFEAAEAAIDRALELNPNDAMSYAIRGDVMVYGGRPEEAIQPLETALQLDPYPVAWWLVDLGQAYYLKSRYADVVALFDRFTGDFEEDPGPHALLAAAYAQQGESEAAGAAAEELRRVSPFFDSESFVRSIVGAEHQRHLLDGLRKAGL